MNNEYAELENYVGFRLLNIESKVEAAYDNANPFFDYSKPLEEQWIYKELFNVIKMYFDEREKIVRCKDCVDCTEEGIYTPQYYCCSRHWNYQSWQGTPTEPDGFCAWGKCKEK